MWSLLVTLILQDHMSKRKGNPSSLTGLRGLGIDVPEVSNQPAKLVSTSFLPTKYLESLEEVVDDDNVFDNAEYSLSRDLVDSFSGYSSLLSWNHEDEFELEASNRVQAMFHDINSALFDRTKTGSKILDHECDEWSDKYPHIRVNGVQLLEPEDEGAEYFAPDPFIMNRYLLEGLSLGQHDHTDLFQLCVCGHQIKPLPIPPSVLLAITSSSKRDRRNIVGPYEELIAADGIVEEYFAFDATGDELTGSSHGKGRRANKRRGLPPITPNACVKDTVGSQVFDLIWAEVVVILKPLLQAVRGGASSYSNRTPSPTLDAPSNLIGRAQDLHNFKPSVGGAGAAVGDSNIASLQDLMRIKPLPLQTRQPPLMARCHTSFASHDHIMSDGQDHNLLLGHQDQYGLIRTNRYTPLPGSRPDTMGTGRLISGSWNRRNMATLKPLDKPRTPANLDEGTIVCLRGQRIASMNGTTPSWARSGQLPPLEDTMFDKRSPPPIRSSAHKARSTGLASRMTITGLENSSHSDIQQILCITSNDAPTSLRSDTPKIPPPSARRHSNHLSYSHTPLKMIGHTPGYYPPPLDEDDVTDDVAWGVTSNNKPQSTSSKHRLRGIIR